MIINAAWSTEQRLDSYINLLDYGSRWYDPALGRFLSPDTIVPSLGEGNNPIAVGYVANANYSALVVNYNEIQLLDQLNQENSIRLRDPSVRLPGIPTNPLAFDRYAYAFNNPVRYNDPSGHCPACAVVGIGLLGISPVGWVIIGVVAVGAVVFIAAGGPEAFARNAVDLGEQIKQGTEAFFAKGEYIPHGLSAQERNAYREAVHKYKQVWGVGARDDVPKEILDEIADAIKQGLKPGEAAESVDGPPEADGEVEGLDKK